MSRAATSAIADAGRAALAALLALLLVGPAAAAAGEFSVEAPVIRVEPQYVDTSERVPSERCAVPPTERSDLVRVLAWDLGAGPCVDTIRQSTASGFLVTYRWNDRLHQRTMARHPGDSVLVTVSVD